MQSYVLSRVLSDNFRGIRVDTLIDDPEPRHKPLIFKSSGKMTHYGQSVFRQLEVMFPRVWRQAKGKQDADLDNTNRNKSQIVWYLDGSDRITLKHLLPEVSTYAIKNSESLESAQLWIQKPSHAYIGSGRFISISDNYRQLVESRPKEYQISEGLSFPIENWVIQPLVEPKLWQGDRKFDCRFYGVIFNTGLKVYAMAYKYGIARICVNPYNPLEDYKSAITNISVQETIEGFSEESNVPLILDDLNVTGILLREIVHNSFLNVDRTKTHILILGFDVMFSPDGTPKLIEVNHEPHIELFRDNPEKFCTTGVVSYVFGQLIPALIDYNRNPKVTIPGNEDWTLATTKI